MVNSLTFHTSIDFYILNDKQIVSSFTRPCSTTLSLFFKTDFIQDAVINFLCVEIRIAFSFFSQKKSFSLLLWGPVSDNCDFLAHMGTRRRNHFYIVTLLKALFHCTTPPPEKSSNHAQFPQPTRKR